MIRVNADVKFSDVIDSNEFREMISRGHASIGFSTDGFWSYDHICVTVSRRWISDSWDFCLSSSSGGRDTGVVKSDAVAYLNMSNTLRVAAELCAELESRSAEFDAIYQERCAIERAMIDQKEAEKKALVDADQPLPSAKSKVLIEQLKNGKIEKINVFERGVADQIDTIRVTSSRSGQTHFINKFGRRIVYNALLALLNKSSVRTTGV